jgi:hypothetical protein
VYERKREDEYPAVLIFLGVGRVWRGEGDKQFD